MLQAKLRDGWFRLPVEHSDSTSLNGRVFNYFLAYRLIFYVAEFSIFH